MTLGERVNRFSPQITIQTLSAFAARLRCSLSCRCPVGAARFVAPRRREGEGQGEGKRLERTAPKSKGSRVTTHLKCRVPDFRDGTEVPLSVGGVACKAHNLMNHPTR